MDITRIVPIWNKAGASLVSILTEHNDTKEFDKIVSIISKYCTKNKQLLRYDVPYTYMYDLVYEKYKAQIVEKINSKYVSYALNILHSKYAECNDMIVDRQ